MTRPITATCEVFIDGARFADTGPDLTSGTPTLLDGLQITWGRQTTVDQPDVSTCQFVIGHRDAGADALRVLGVGSTVQVWSTGTLAGTAAGVETFLHGTYTDVPDTPDSDDAGWSITSGGTSAIVGHAVRSAMAGRSAGTAYPYVQTQLPPERFIADSGDPLGWDHVPRAHAGQEWAFGVDVTTGAPSWPTRVEARLAFIPTGLDGGGTPYYTTPVAVVCTGTTTRITGTGTVPALAEGYYATLLIRGFNDRLGWDAMPAGAVVTRTNEAVNPGAEIGTICWRTQSSSLYTPTSDPVTPIAGAQSYLLTRTATTPSLVVSQLLATTGAGGVTTQFPVTPGQTVTAGVDVRVGAAGWNISTRWYFYDAASVLIAGGVETTRVTNADPGPVYRVVETGTVPAGAVKAYFAVFVRIPAGGANTVGGERVWYDRLTVDYAGTDGTYFDGSTAPTGGTSYRWTGTPNGSTSQAYTGDLTGTWDGQPATWDQSAPTLLIDNVSVLAPTDAFRQVLAWAGRVSDVTATPDEPLAGHAPGVTLAVTAVDFTADLSNRYIGDEPWPAEHMGNRFQRVIELADPSIDWQTDDAIEQFTVSWRDVDNQSAWALLADLATTVDSVVWSAVHGVTGPYLWVEDPRGRVSVQTIGLGPGGVWVIVASPRGEVVVLSSCDVLNDAVQFTSDAGDVLTRVDAVWLEQTVNDDGEQEPTERTITVVDTAAETAFGVHRAGWTSQLTRAADAQLFAESILTRSRSVDYRISGLTWDTAIPTEASDEIVQAALDVLDGTRRIGLGTVITDLPPWAPAGDVGVYVEGGTYTYAAGRWVFALTVSPGAVQAKPITWNAAPAGWTWDNTDPAIDWRAMASVGPPAATSERAFEITERRART